MELTDFLTEEGKNVNWKAVHKISPRLREDTIYELKQAGFLTSKATGNYGLIRCGIVVNPNSHLTTYYFPSIESVKDYRQAFHKDQKDAIIFQIV